MEEGFERLFTIFFGGLVIWAILSVLVFYARLRFAQYVAKEKCNRVKRQHQNRKGGNKKAIKKSIKPKEPVVIDKDYELAKNTFNLAMRNGQLSREKILGLKDLLNKMLSGVKKYDSYYFKNDCHEIYAKLKDGNLGMLEYQEITNYINKGVEENESINNGNVETV